MKHYSEERKEAALAKMMPPQNMAVSAVAEETGISQQTLYNWRQKAREEGIAVPGDGKNAEKWSSADKFAVVLETTSMNEAELGEYCRKNGLYVEQIAQWKESCMNANASTQEQTKVNREKARRDQKKIKNWNPN